MKKYEYVAVDLQNDFATEGGKFYTYKPSVDFLNTTLFPYFREHNLKINEIISDYRQPRPGDLGEGCNPGKWGYKSIVPAELRKSLWVKCMNSPIWIRKNIGEKDKQPGLPYADSQLFGKWIDENIGTCEETIPVIFGLTIDCCVLSIIQEFRWRGYEPIVIKEAVDHATGKLEDKNIVLEKTAIRWWAEAISWDEFLERLSL